MLIGRRRTFDAPRHACSFTDAVAVVAGCHLTLPMAGENGGRLKRALHLRAPGPVLLARGSCSQRCGRPRWGVWCLYVKSNGVAVGMLRCCVCGNKMREIGASKLSVEIVPVWNQAWLSPCEHCGTDTSVELHHFAPRHLFDDADEWPTAWLCPPCHQLWHRVVTPDMAKRKVAA